MTSLLLSTAAVAQSAAGTSTNTRTMPKTAIAMSTAAPIVATPSPAPVVEGAPVEVKEFRGTVVDDLGEPLAGVVVSIVSAKNQFSAATTTTTNSEGEYLLRTTNASPVLLVSYAGYEDIQQQATYARPITFQLEAIDNYERQLKKKVKAAEKAWHK
ncbi:carboxypeptidase regulatory-like domain-containing protein [Hymenobacter sp. YC55]|uniref:carboxypeptidase regulatory-like domain-containing protein n=1 Tax=Hymenobacter sp. YC55 TaxID=3034019 RepID=UPI0023F9A157|nr:carboxypeptidase regulatory-like domain-containing protein [Hymenobacter sp. YC55]